MHVYQRSEDDQFGPEFLFSSKADLAITDPTVDLFAMKQPTMVVNLQNPVTKTTIAKGFETLLKSTDDDNGQYELVREVEFLGDTPEESLRVRYISLTYAIYGWVEITLCGNGSCMQEDGYEVYGDILASYCTLNQPHNLMVVPLIKRTEEEAEWIKLGDEIELCRYKLCVPAYSSLSISIRLNDASQSSTTVPLINGSVSFHSHGSATDWGRIQGNGGVYAYVKIDWCEPYKLHKIRHDETPTLPMCIQPVISSALNARQVVQVFSIFIGHRYSGQLRVYGFVSTRDGRGCSRLFKRDRDSPCTLSDGLLPLDSLNRVITPGDGFSISLDINDVEQRVSIKGAASSSHGMNNRKSHWYDRLYCSVIRGDQNRCFAAIYYTVFSAAVQARVGVSVIKKGSCGDGKVNGHVIAYYDCFTAASKYEEKHYRSVLFMRMREGKRKRDNLPEEDERLELIRDVLAVPISGRILFEVKLEVDSPNGTQLVQQVVGFSVGEFVKVINGMDFDVYISMEWSSA